MRFHIGRLTVSVSFPFCALIAAMLIIDKTGLMLFSLSAILIHEAGHLIAMRAEHCLPKEIKLRLGGLIIVGGAEQRPREKAIIMLSGPLTNIAAAVLLFTVAKHRPTHAVCTAALTQAVVGVFNLLPVKGLDGGTVLHCLLNFWFSESTARMTLCLISLLFSAVIMLAGVFAVFTAHQNPTLFILGTYLLILNIPVFGLGEPL